MLNTIFLNLVILIMLFLSFGVAVHAKLSKPVPPENLLCFKGKLLSQVEGGGTVYTQLSEFSCNYDNDSLVISNKTT